jgi:catechol 2,3-dioxygenase
MTAPAEPIFALTRPAHIGRVDLVVGDLDLVSGFYRHIVGLELVEKSQNREVLGVAGVPLLALTEKTNAARAPRTAAGLFHTAFLVPNRQALAGWLQHAAENKVALDGASDHLVSEAVYLSDPEGNGIEIYRDRTPEEWTYDEDGTVEMATHRLNLQELYDSVPAGKWAGMPEGTAIGHIHLQVGDIPKADAFYRDVLGLKIMARYPGASFFATGGYHHHVAANIWNSRGASIRQENMIGLSRYALHFNDRAVLDAALASLDGHGIAVEKTSEGWSLKDPWGIGITLSA